MPSNTPDPKVFDQFTRKYSLSRTLKFSLIPVLTEEQEEQIVKDKGYENSTQIRRQDKIEKFFIENKQNVFDVDIERKKRYKALKYYLTELHKLFIKDALGKAKEDTKLDFSKLFEAYEAFEISKDSDQRKRFAKIINDRKIELAKCFGNKDGKGGLFQTTAEYYYDWLKKNLADDEKIADDKDGKQRKNNIFLSQNVLLILDKKIKEGVIREKAEKNKDEQSSYILSEFEYLKKGKIGSGTLTEYFDGWSTYFKNFNEIRSNLYKDEGRKEEDEIKGDSEAKIKKANAGQLTTRILDENFEIFVRNAVWAKSNIRILKLIDFQSEDIINNVSVFAPEYYKNCLLQSDINEYNKKIAELNKFFNENKNSKEVKYLKPLYKQLLLSDGLEEEENNYIREFIDDNDFINGLDEFYSHSCEKISIISGFLDGEIEDDLTDIQLNENQLHFFCNKYFGSWSYLRDLYYKQNNIEERNQSKKDAELKNIEGISMIDISLWDIKTLLDNETKENFMEAVENGWFCRDYKNYAQSNASPLREYDIYKDEVGNFDNFISFLQFEINSLLNGRDLLTKKEQGDKNKIGEIKSSLEKSRDEGERVDSLLLSKFSEEYFKENLVENIEAKQKKFQQAFQEIKKSVENKEKLMRDREFECKKNINEYCDRISSINSFFALFNVPEGVAPGFINSTVAKFKDDNQIIPLFDAIRNFITKRPDETEKIKLNFDYQLLMGGWAYKTTDYKCRILKKNDKYYLLIIGNARQEDDPIKVILPEFEIMNYYQQKGQTIFGSVYQGKFEHSYDDDRNKLPNVDFIRNLDKIIDDLKVYFPKAKERLEMIKNMLSSDKFVFSISREKFLKLFKEKTEIDFSGYKNRKDLPKKEDLIIEILKGAIGDDKFDYEVDKDYLINRIKEITKKEALKTDFLGSDRLVYEITKLEPYFYENSFRPLDFYDQDSALNNRHLFLFQIYCKDFSDYRKEESAKDLNTLYFEELFSEENQKDPIFKLSGGAEAFFREEMDNNKIEQWERKDLKRPQTDKLPNKKRRFTEKQILFHLPIVLNNISDGKNINREVHEYVQTNEDVKMLGIDRGEKELAYYCLLNKDGKIVEKPATLNIVGSNIVVDGNGQEKKQSINYRNKLDVRERERMIARRLWTKIEGIKDLKQGYISNVVNNIARLMVSNNAFVCFEELNYGFKKDRSIRIEKGVYQRLENALVEKLNYLVLKKIPYEVRNALQLTPENRPIKYWGNQMGAIFYTDAKYTSKTCPHCGFRRRGVDGFKKVEDLIGKKAKDGKIEKEGKINAGDLKVFYEKDKDRFRVEYNWQYKYQENNEEKELSSKDLYGGKMETIYSDIDRQYWNDATLKELFKQYLDSDNEELFCRVRNDKSFKYSDFIKVFESLIWLRHNIEKEGKKYDRISCPKCHFSTMSEKVQNVGNGDANGAYNIARRGLMIYEKIRSEKLRKKINTKDGIKSADLKVTLKEWDEITFKQWDKKDWNDSNNEREL